MSTQVEKQQFENNTGGWIGAVTIDAKGNDAAIAVAPGQRVWLSEPEQRLTAEAPQSPQDNPFVAQSFERIDTQSGERVTVEITPLTLVSDARYVPASDRFVPADAPDTVQQAHADQAAKADTPEQPTSASDPVADRTTEVMGSPDAAADPAPEAPPETPAPETGAAVPPSDPAPAGAFSTGEEVGTPDAPQPPAEGAQAGPPAPPAPWTPGSTE